MHKGRRYHGWDKNAFTLLSNEFNSDALEQKLLGCGHSRVTMASSAQYVDDGVCL